VLSLQLKSGGSSSQCAPVGLSSAGLNDQRALAPPVQVATQIYLLAAQSTVAEASVRREVFGVLLTSGSNRAGWLHCGFATQGDGQPQPARPSRGEEMLMA
jgi:hypothetical protein